jgi:hypothetical protein
MSEHAPNLVLHLPYPPKALWPNRRNNRNHWPTTRARRQVRRDTAILARAAMGRRMGEPRWELATWRATFVHPLRRDGRRGKAHDRDNLIAVCKPILDALEDVGVVANDVGLIPRPPQQRHVDGGRPLVILELWEGDPWGIG